MALNSRCRSCNATFGPEDFDEETCTQPALCFTCNKRQAAARAASNPFEDAGRMRKVIAMVEVIDRNALANGINPFDQAGRIQLAAYGWNEATWRTIAMRVNPKSRKPPSAKTRDMVIEVYKGRASAPLSRQVAS